MSFVVSEYSHNLKVKRHTELLNSAVKHDKAEQQTSILKYPRIKTVILNPDKGEEKKGLNIGRLPFMMKPRDSEEETVFSRTSEHLHLLKTTATIPWSDSLD